MAIWYTNDDIFNSYCQTLVNTVNCQGVMGKGLAKQFKQRFPIMYQQYCMACKNWELKDGGDLWLYNYGLNQGILFEDNDVMQKRHTKILCFATKKHWMFKSRYEWIERGMDEFVAKYKEWGIESIAFPKLGCTNGGLDWDKVKDIMIPRLEKCDINVEIHI